MDIMQKLGRNITRINVPHSDDTEALKRICVKCTCTTEQRDGIRSMLVKCKAIDITLSDMNLDEQQHTCIITYSVLNQRGSLYDSLTAFQVCITLFLVVCIISIITTGT